MSRRLCPLVLAADSAYAMPLATTIRSVAEANAGAWPLEIHVIHDGIDGATQQRIFDSSPLGSVTIDWHTIDVSLFASDYIPLPYISRMTFARLVLPGVLADKAGKVLYLDSDILVFGDLSPLCDIDLGDAVIGAALDPLDAPVKQNKLGLEKVPRVGHYFNAGVLLIDLGNWRNAQVTEKALHYLDRFPNSPFSDQDALNVACDGYWKQLDNKWNFQCEPHESIVSPVDAERPAIAHFITKSKPWKPSSMSVNAACYDAVRAKTRFARSMSEIAREEIAILAHKLLKRSSLVRSVWSLAKGFRSARPAIIAQSHTEDDSRVY
ncbi:glycosyltransferase family 8 protein [Rhizobium sp. 16-488-2a]|nr:MULTISPECIES: glycosyltransferase family 8 protein [unclassified Rhizobium]MBO9127497.1 glycosyltransferase family 8 protein [Rhizobium sp. 16-488-2b]MBO9177940.1 glycosyltransferase family 8 protein [Rhizobium sp. 16-488-2a]